MKKIKYLFKSLLVITALVFTSCETEDHEFGDIVNPTNLQVSAEIVGADDNNPNGDGSGTVHLTAVADNAITYKFVSNGVETMSPSGMITYNFPITVAQSYSDLVTVVVPVNAPRPGFIYENKINSIGKSKNHFVSINFRGTEKNKNEFFFARSYNFYRDSFD